MAPIKTNRPHSAFALLLTVCIAAAHIFLVWGYTRFGGDPGRWRHEVERFVRGETVYRDFVWPFPPMALWLLGWIQKLTSPGTVTIFIACAVLTLLIALLYWKYCSLLLRDGNTIAVVSVLGVLLAVGYAQIESDPLPSGMYTPAAPIGFLFLLTGLCCWISGKDILAGLACGLAIVTKQDFWLPAAAILLACWTNRKTGRWIAPLCGFAVVASGIGIIAVQAGWRALPLILTGYGRAQIQAARGLPSWERVSAEVAGLALIAGVGFAAMRRAGIAFAALGVTIVLAGALYFGDSHFKGARVVFLEQQFPWLLPFCFLPWAFRSGRTDLAWLLGIALAARARRGFEHTEWYAFLIELPIYALILTRENKQRAIPALAGTLGAIALAAYWQFGTGPFTSDHRYQHREWVRTAKGPAKWSGPDGALYRLLRTTLKDDQAPLYALNYRGGFNYYLDRPNPSPGDEITLFTGRDIQPLIASIRAAHPVLLERQDPYGIRVPSGISLKSWKLLTQPNYVETKERVLFRAIAAGCARSSLENSVPPYWIYHCP